MRFFASLWLTTAALQGAVLAQTPGNSDPPPPEDPRSLISLIIEDTGWLFWPLAALSIAAVFLIIFYFLTVRRGSVVSDRFMNSADALIRKQDYLGLLAVCNRQDESISRITAKTLEFATKNPTASFDEVREVTEAEGSRQAGLLHQRIQYLADIGAIAPMLGLLGTVFGMISAFNDISQHTFVNANQTDLATGVAQALHTTAGGLCIGIPALVFYSLFRGRVMGLVAELEAASTHIMALLAAQYKRATRAAGAGNRPRQATSSKYVLEDHADDIHGG